MFELLSDIDWFFHQPAGFQAGASLIPLIMAGLGTLVLNAIAGTSDAAKMIANFCTLLAGAVIAMALIALVRLPGDVMVIATFAAAAGMTIASLSTMAVFKPAS
jgi:hypothetical protein